MTRIECIALRFASLWETADSTELTKLIEIVLAPSKNLMSIGLMTNVENNLVLWQIHNPVKGDRQLYSTQIRRKMPTCLRDIRDNKLSYLVCKGGHIRHTDILYVIFLIYLIQYTHC